MSIVAPLTQSGRTPRVCVIVPAFGVAHLLADALDSMLGQHFTQWECIVIDDGAPDDVAGAVRPYLADPRIRFLTTPNHGVSAARNAAIAASHAPLIALLDGDDLFRPAYLATMVPLLEADPAIRFATCNAMMFGAVSQPRLCLHKPQGSSDGVRGSLTDVLDRSFGVYIGTCFRRVDFDRIGGFDTSMTQAEDLDLWVRLMQLGGHAYFVDQILGDYRVRANSASAHAGRMLIGNMRVYEKARATLPVDHVAQPLITQLINHTQCAISFEHAMDRVIDGEIQRGLNELRQVRTLVNGPVWACSFALWRIFPQLAQPMLRWRRRSHRRGAQHNGILAGRADIPS
ncbi:glycosyltransferase family 2 protein [Aquisediminimonas sediminicola]|uniref:glycosyltransferase family 2 protein n=1 Tax=Alteraquisediminimonas sediminicola TaxID=2676787 RepID=UPI001C8E8602|nr:glycosyltransferase family A protein [Aquisediminimonas sediminicola]